MNNDTLILCPEAPAAKNSSTRDAVETAIDLAKGNRSDTWEDSARVVTRITRWRTSEHGEAIADGEVECADWGHHRRDC